MDHSTTSETTDGRGRAIAFGRFRLLAEQRLLLEGDAPLRLGSRALEILIALVERHGELVTKHELMKRVWPNIIVEEGNLKVQVAALRRVLGDGHGGNRYLVNVPGRGYRFVAPVMPLDDGAPATAPALAPPCHNLPAPVTRLIGRAEQVAELAALLAEHRCLTIVGPGGIGKTSVALAVAEMQIARHEHGVWRVDIASIGEPRLVPRSVASALGLQIRSDAPLVEIAAALRDRRMLLLLDDCEHVVEAVAELAAALLRAAPALRIIATSREPLRVTGERLHRLAPLACPPSGVRLGAREALEYPAVQLFVERAAAALGEYELADADAPVVIDLCRALDGMALAIEFAAARIDIFGLRGLAQRLDDRLRLLTSGTRTALPRHQTLRALLDWSHDLLDPAARMTLRRLAIFAGSFTLRAAGAVASDDAHPEAEIVERTTELVAKSLVQAEMSDAEPRFRLLETTRAYALAKLAETGEREALARRHAEYYRNLLEAAARDSASGDDWPALYTAEIDNINAALAWAFGPGGDPSVGVALKEASAPVWFEMSLLTECHHWTTQALAGLEAAARGTRQEMALQTALGISLQFASGPTGAAYAALTRAAELARALRDPDFELRALHGLGVFALREAEFRNALDIARSAEEIARTLDDAVAMPTAHRLHGVVLHFLGDQAGARTHLERALGGQRRASRHAYVVRNGIDNRVSALATLAHVQWLQGCPDQAMATAREAVAEAQSLEHPVSLCSALATFAAPLAMGTGDLETAERELAMLQETATRHGLGVYDAYCEAMQGWIVGRRGEARRGAALCAGAIGAMQDTRFHVCLTMFLAAMAELHQEAGQLREGLAAVEAALERCERHHESWCMPEILRIKGELMLRGGAETTAAAEQFRRSLDIAARDGALSWELRSAMSLARLLLAQGERDAARSLLAPVLGRFAEGFGTADLREAQTLLAAMQ